MLAILQGFAITILEVICCKIFYDTFIQEDDVYQLRNYLVLCGLCVCDIAIAMILYQYFLLKEGVIIMVTSVAMKIYTQKSWRKVIVLAAIYQGILLLTDYITIAVEAIFELQPNFSQSFFGSMVTILDKAILLFIILLIRKAFQKKESVFLQDSDWLKLLFFPIFTICIIAAMIKKNTRSINSDQKQLFIVIALGLIGVNIAIFYFLSDIIRREKLLGEQRIFEYDMKNKLEMYEALSKNVEKQRRLSHEYQNQINLIQGLCEDGQIEELKKYLNEINGEVCHHMDCIDTHHAIVNAVINKKYFEAREKGILFVLKISDLSELKINNQDIALLLSNLLNNAIEASEKCKDHKMIKLKLVYENGKMILSVKNHYCGTIMREDNEWITSKRENTEAHGYGLKNVITVVNRNHGDYAFHVTEDEFMISICI